jgi:predicted AAA+ superfamily ATPase
MRRKIYDKLLKWKQERNGDTALLIEGARRIGKSYTAEEFARNEYESYILIDFSKAPARVKSWFDDYLEDVDTLLPNIQLHYKKTLTPRKSLIIFDEVQKCPRAREAIKTLVADHRFDYLETGSLISIKKNVEDIVIPSEEEGIDMYPMDFEEFKWALGDTVTIKLLRESFEKYQPLGDDLNRTMMRDFRLYMLVGGMPQAIVAFKKNGRDFHAADVEKRDILALYEDDIKKAAKKYKSKVSAIFDNIPGFLSTHEKRVVLSKVDSDNGTFDRYDEPLFWLGDSMICNLCYKCNDPNVGLALNKNESYVKCYMGDTGLLVSHAFSENEIMDEQLYKQIMDGKLSLNQGMLYENMIAQMITASGRKLFFYTRYSEEKHRNDIEIDFII